MKEALNREFQKYFENFLICKKEPIMNVILNPDARKVDAIRNFLKTNGGYCPCQINRSEDTICPCKKFRENKECCCELYVEVKDEN